MARGYMAINAGPLIAFTIASVSLTYLRTRRGRNTICKQLKSRPLILGPSERGSIENAIRETCQIRKWDLRACNVRTNHVHAVVTANRQADLVLNSLQANATRQLRQDKLWLHPFSPWAHKGSKILLWTEQSVANAIDYVLNGQGQNLPKI